MASISRCWSTNGIIAMPSQSFLMASVSHFLHSNYSLYLFPFMSTSNCVG